MPAHQPISGGRSLACKRSARRPGDFSWLAHGPSLSCKFLLANRFIHVQARSTHSELFISSNEGMPRKNNGGIAVEAAWIWLMLEDGWPGFSSLLLLLLHIPLTYAVSSVLVEYCLRERKETLSIMHGNGFFLSMWSECTAPPTQMVCRTWTELECFSCHTAARGSACDLKMHKRWHFCIAAACLAGSSSWLRLLSV